jgi:hypothetical protein
VSDNQARRNAARRLMRETGVNYQAALLAVTAEQAAQDDDGAASIPDGTDHLPAELRELVRAHCWRVTRYLDRAMNETRILEHVKGRGPCSKADREEWERITLYSLSDAARQLNLLLGTLALDLQTRGADSRLLQRFLQTDTEDEALAYITDDARDHHAGLTGGPVPPDSQFAVWHSTGEAIRDSGAGDSDPHFDMTECFLAALHGSPKEDPGIFDGFTPPMQALATELAQRKLKAVRELTATHAKATAGS